MPERVCRWPEENRIESSITGEERDERRIWARREEREEMEVRLSLCLRSAASLCESICIPNEVDGTFMGCLHLAESRRLPPSKLSLTHPSLYSFSSLRNMDSSRDRSEARRTVQHHTSTGSNHRLRSISSISTTST